MLTSFEILALRKEHHHEQALNAARELYQKSAIDLWTVRAFGWCLYDAITGCKKCSFSGAHDTLERSELIREFIALPITKDDDLLLRKRAELTDPFAGLLLNARKEQEEGRVEKARAILTNALQKNPKHEGLNESLGWILWRLCLNELKKENPAPSVIQGLLREYAHLQIAKSSDLSSRMLSLAAKAAKSEIFPSFCGFCKWWDFNNLQPSDWLSKIDSGQIYDSLAEQVIKGIHKTLPYATNQGVAFYCVEFLLNNFGKYPKQEWFPYYAGEALLLLGRSEEARELLMPILRTKMSEFWAWHTLARTFPVGDSRRLSLLCKAVTCPVKGPEFLLNVKIDLANELVRHGLVDLAHHEIQQVVEIRKTHGWPIRGEMSEIIESEWFKSSKPHENKEYIRQKAGNALEVLTEGLPWLKAIVSIPKVCLGKEQNLGSIIDVLDTSSKLCTIPVRQAKFPQLTNLNAGAAIEVRIDTNGEKTRVIELRLRSAPNWDILDVTPALVRYTNSQKGFSILVLFNGQSARVYHADVEGASDLRPGIFIGCQVVPDHDSNKVRHITGEIPWLASANWRQYQGNYMSRQKGGGHAEGVFIPENLSVGYADGDKVSGLCAKMSDRISKRTWWEAVTSEKVF